MHAGSRWLGPAFVHGTMRDVRGHPGLVPGRTGSGRIEGELVHVTDASLWERLDAHEGVGEEGWYVRGLVVAIDGKGDARSAWAYVAPTAS